VARVKLSGSELRKTEKLLVDTFDVSDIKRSVRRNYRNLHDEVDWSGRAAGVMSDFVDRAQQFGVFDKVLVSLVESRPDRPELLELQLALSTKPGWGVKSGPHGLDSKAAVGELERVLGAGNPFVAAKGLAVLMANAPHQVCHIQVGSGGGTGFLIGPNLVMTNYHVVEKHLKRGTDVKVRFGWFSADEADDWLDIDTDWEIPHSKYSKADSRPPFGVPAPDELDYAVIKLSSSPGEDDLDHGVRGWVDLSDQPPLPEVGSPGILIGHPANDNPPPQQQPLSVSFEARAFEDVNDNATRVAYRVDTKPGSSGSPVFDGNMRPVVLHHNRGELFEGEAEAGSSKWSSNNRGIPLRTIWAALPDAVKNELQAP
jgi:hypothetical protein